jgi:acyl-CoA synthetase (AMP-forming)/AMP-acid ligase II
LRHRRAWYELGLYQADDLGTLIGRSLRAGPDVALTFATGKARQVLSFAELDRRSAAVAAGLARLGQRPGDRLLLQLPSSAELVIAMVAALRAGVVVVPLPTAAGGGHLEAALADSGARVLIVPGHWRGVGYADRLVATANAAGLEHVLVTGPEAPADLAFSRVESGPPDFVAGPCDPDAACALIYTSGSSGRPKGVQHSHNSLLAEVRTGWASQSGEDVRHTFVPLPPGHVGGLISTLIPLVTRRPAAFLEPWDRSAALELIREVGATIMGSVPFFLIELLDALDSGAAGPQGLAPLVFSSQGGAGVPPVLVERAEATGLCVARSYGLTEHPTVTSGTAADGLRLRAHTDGVPTPGNRVRIVDEAGRELPAGEIGEIVTVGPELMLGYTDPGQDLAAHLPGGWFRTGDLGRIEPGSGALTVSGRLKENVLMRHPAVVEAAVIGVPDERYGERLLAVVVPRHGAALDLDSVRAHFAAAGTGRLLTPELLDIVPALPRGATGKVQRAQLLMAWETRRRPVRARQAGR